MHDESRARMGRPVEIVEYRSHHRTAFRELNLEWIAGDFVVEAADRIALDDPEGSILRPGGHILMAEDGDQVLGACALIRLAPHVFELAKMAVTPSARGRGIGELLGRAAVERAKRLGAQRVELVSNTALQPALGLYRKLGFTEAPLGPAKYQRANIRMILDLADALKSVLILRVGLPVGLATNAAAVLALGLGHRVPCLRGSDPTDRSGETHSGLTWLTLPVLQATADRLKAIRLEALSHRTITMVDLPVVAQQARTEREYARALAQLSAEEVEYVGVGLFGERDTVTALSGALSLLR